MEIQRNINKQVRCYNCGITASADIFTEITSLEFKDIIDPDVKPTHRCECGSTAYQVQEVYDGK
tara:strand:+ start:1470 stop:1661 length:192 start_codon:yes stop_codon:yes gene_type:complete